MGNIQRNLSWLFLAVAAHCLPGAAIAATSTTATSNGVSTFTVASSPLGGIAGCGIVAGVHYYGATSFTTTSAASYSFTGTAQTGTTDSFLALYKGSFNPASPTVNLVGCDDDSGGNRLPKFVANLEAATTYVMVATTYGAAPFTGNVAFSAGIAPNISLAPLSAAVGATGRSMVATSDSPMPITYASSNPAVATIDPATGAVNLLAVGTAVITASQAAQPDPLPFAAGAKAVPLTVTAVPVAPAGPQPVPTLSEVATLLMATLLALFGLGRLRRRR
ncbi:IPTL-CTERM protein sorting domain [Delftia tsuruhatensis]|uniref:IPTL-CTERM sorting domain-containing protein n=1 Tax=Delftia tsuruhatensis TaxID=180282 RepID=UPI001E75F946|nr:IPTL-CTERM sorting domain-containing protein [Delftia tsuruhatensis]CAB5710936.1 IPTL-CTERM protein sorting domain [Delftia tsuruhatensis]CAC9692310.1 IPTL-CTERM protein sorting domain [Delftia tsuruhatensis]